VSDFTLTAQSPLGGYKKDFEGVTLTELTDLAVVSIATPMGGRDALASAVDSAFGAALPNIGHSSHTEDGNTRFLGLQRDQMFLLFEHEGDGALAVIADKLGEVGYYTDQSDTWAILRMAGPGSRTALERICMLDLSPDVFAVGAVARSTMEHLGVMILRDDTDSFLLMSSRSSARSFLHAIETSIDYTT
jgi:heterotetrameric sarcosine oxidase gamma subunit